MSRWRLRTRSHPSVNGGDDAGAAGIEFVGLVPVAVLGVGVALQIMASVTAAQSTHQAAREAARVYAETGSMVQADVVARRSIPSGMTVTSVSAVGPWHGVRVEVQAPLMHRALIAQTISQEVVMP